MLPGVTFGIPTMLMAATKFITEPLLKGLILLISNSSPYAFEGKVLHQGIVMQALSRNRKTQLATTDYFATHHLQKYTTLLPHLLANVLLHEEIKEFAFCLNFQESSVVLILYMCNPK